AFRDVANGRPAIPPGGREAAHGRLATPPRVREAAHGRPASPAGKAAASALAARVGGWSWFLGGPSILKRPGWIAGSGRGDEVDQFLDPAQQRRLQVGVAGRGA